METVADLNFLDVERLVQHTCSRVQRRYAFLDFDELYSEALVIYQEAVLRFDEDAGDFNKWIVFKLWTGLTSRVKRLANQHRILKRRNLDTDDGDGLREIADYRHEFNRTDFLGSLSDDAATICALIFDSTDIRFALRDTNSTPHKMQAAIKDALADLGWAADAVESSLAEIAHALTN